jgi:hypothetical protein
MKRDPVKPAVHANVRLARAGSPQEVQVTVRLPKNNALKAVTVNGETAKFGGRHGDAVIFRTQNQKNFDVVVEFG